MDDLTVDERRILGRQHTEIEELRERVADLEEKLKKADNGLVLACSWIAERADRFAAFQRWVVKREGK